MQPEEQLIKQRLEKLEKIKRLGVNPYPYKFEVKNFSTEILSKYSKLKKEGKSNDKVILAGRVTSMRPMGKIAFGHIQDSHGKIQFFINEKELGKKEFELFNLLDLGDIIGISGNVFRTKASEITISVKKLELLTKSLRPLPDKWHGLKDIEERYRKRYVDLIVNPEVKEIFIKKFKIVNSIRETLNKHDYIEVDTPIIQPVYGGANAKPFKTYVNDLKRDAYLRISDELYLKRLIVGGFDKVYELNKDFRNESIDSTHNPEFSMIEFYQAYADYHDMMKLTEEIISNTVKAIGNKNEVNFMGNKINLKTPFKVMTVKEAIKKFGNIDVNKLNDKGLFKLKEKYKLEHRGILTRGWMIQLLFEHFAEPKLIQPVFITEHPRETTPLCKWSRKDSSLIERFELFIGGFEISNGYSELNDPIIQRKLLEEQAKELKEGVEDANPMDEDFIKAIEQGMPPTGGVGIGTDRLTMVLTGSNSIKDVILFPMMKN
ncbi:MAG: lysine--tRNA ligase, partial [Nanoarchaeota archaeon]